MLTGICTGPAWVVVGLMTGVVVAEDDVVVVVGVHLRHACWCDWILRLHVGGGPLLVTVAVQCVLHLEVTRFVLV